MFCLTAAAFVSLFPQSPIVVDVVVVWLPKLLAKKE